MDLDRYGCTVVCRKESFWVVRTSKGKILDMIPAGELSTEKRGRKLQPSESIGEFLQKQGKNVVTTEQRKRVRVDFEPWEDKVILRMIQEKADVSEIQREFKIRNRIRQNCCVNGRMKLLEKKIAKKDPKVLELLKEIKNEKESKEGIIK